MTSISRLVIFIVAVVLALLASAIRILREYERAVVFTLGRFTGVKGPGLILIVPFVQTIARVALRTIVLDVPTQDVISQAERERRAPGHQRGRRTAQAAQKLLEAAEILSGRAESMQLRYLGALGNIAGEKSSTVVFPFPVEFGRFFEMFARHGDNKQMNRERRARGDTSWRK